MGFIFQHIAKLPKNIIIGAAVILTLLVGLLDKVTGAELSVSLFYLIPISICAWFVDRWSAISLSILSAAIFFYADKITNSGYSHPLIIYWNALIELGFFVTISLTLSTLRSSIDLESNLAIRIQQGLLPKQLPTLKNREVSVIWLPKLFVSGDYYDFINFSDDKVGICIGDVAGHGVAAALLMSNLQAIVRQISHRNESTNKICYQLNNSLLENEMPEKFITFFYGIIDLNTNTLEYTNAGHPPALIINSNGEVKKLECGGTMLGVVPNYEYYNDTVKLSDDDTIVFYTDGLIEAKNITGELYGEERFINSCLKYFSSDVNKMSQDIIESVAEFSAGLWEDDVTLLIISSSAQAIYSNP